MVASVALVAQQHGISISSTVAHFTGGVFCEVQDIGLGCRAYKQHHSSNCSGCGEAHFAKRHILSQLKTLFMSAEDTPVRLYACEYSHVTVKVLVRFSSVEDSCCCCELTNILHIL